MGFRLNQCKNLAYRLLIDVIIIGVFATLTTTTFQLYFDYKREIKNVEEGLSQIQSSYLAAIINSLWIYDETQLRIQLEGVLNLPSLEYVQLIGEDAKVIIYLGKIQPAHRVLTREFPLRHIYRDQEVRLGKLEVVASLEPVYRLMFDKAMMILITNGVVVFSVSLGILLIFHTLIVAHLNRIASYMRALNVSNLDQELLLKRGGEAKNCAHENELEQVVSAINVMRITLKYSYTALCESEIYNRTLIAESPIGLALTQIDGVLIDVNLAFANILGRTIQESIGLNLDQLTPEKYVDAEIAQRYSLATTGRYGPYEKEFYRKDGSTVSVRLSGLIIKKNKLDPFIWSCIEDITEQRRAHEALQHAKLVAEAANLAKSRFLANMSHELRTPLNAVIGYSEMLEEELAELGQEDLLIDTRKINLSGKHLLKLINDILDISKIEAGKMDLYTESFDLHNLIHEVATENQQATEQRGNVLAVHLPAELHQIHTDRAKLRQMLLNLLNNAAKFSENTVITLKVESIKRENRDWMIIHVIDQGIGMSEEQQHKIFEPFTQADDSSTRKYGGTGLGLAITKQFSQMLGGNVRLISELDHGSTFTLELPTHIYFNKIETKSLSNSAEIKVLAQNNIVLVIDDEPSMRGLLANYLNKMGYNVEVAATGEEGVEKALELKPQVIILDVVLHGGVLDGWEVLAKLKTDPELAQIPVIMLSIVEDKHKGYSLGAAEFLSKPVNREQLKAVLKKYQHNNHSTVLVLEDDDTTRDMIAHMLFKAGWKVITAENGVRGLECLQSLGQDLPDLILLDLMMPEMDGFEFASCLHQEPAWCAIPIVVLTAKDIDADDRVRLYGCVKTIFQKGAYTREQLLSKVHELVTSV
jgi:PAS domain S-box-containing protein